MEFEAIRRVLAAFEQAGVVYAIFGATVMKRDTVRLKDKADAALLKERFALEDD